MRHAAVLALVLGCPLALPAQARPLERELPLRSDSCWERRYEAAHLAARPRQKVSAIRLMHTPPREGWEAGKVYLQLHFNLRDRKTSGNYDYAYGGFCRASGPLLRCQSERGGGVFEVARAPHGKTR